MLVVGLDILGFGVFGRLVLDARGVVVGDFVELENGLYVSLYLLAPFLKIYRSSGATSKYRRINWKKMSP
jgi:hypothetical protein